VSCCGLLLFVTLATLAIVPVRAQYDADPFHPSYSVEEISNAQGECMRMCILASTERPRSACISQMGLPGYWGCQLANPVTVERTPCDQQMRVIEVSSIDCKCLRTSAGDCISPYEALYDLWKHAPIEFRNRPRFRGQQ